MQCEKCKKNPATIHLTEIVDGQRSEMHLCPGCAHKEGVAVKGHMNINELLNTLLGVEGSGEVLSGAASGGDLVCPVCHTSWEKFRKESLLGCPNDYDVFSVMMDPIIEKAHSGGIKHIGKVPAKAGRDTHKQIELLNLRRELDDAINREDYEKAAQIRDRIKNSN